MKAIETVWKGYRFRSRLEARWAVFFDTLGLTWRYEHQGFSDGTASWLPDFEIDNWQGRTAFVEVKGTQAALADEGDRYASLLPCGSVSQVIFLGDIPEPAQGSWFHPYLSATGWLHLNWATFTPSGWIASTPGDALSRIMDLPSVRHEYGKVDQWRLLPKLIQGPKGWIATTNAYTAARSARFEHGQKP